MSDQAVTSKTDTAERYLRFARALSVDAGQMALEYFRRPLTYKLKDDLSPVTEADTAIQKFIFKAIQTAFPKHGLWGEEQQNEQNKKDRDSEYLWIVDPIDGTAIFTHGLPGWGVSLACFRNGLPEVGCFYLPVTDELYSAARGSGASWTLFASNPRKSERREISIKPGNDESDLHILFASEFHRIFASRLPGKQRSLGSTAHHFCLVARGVANAALVKPYLWDIAAAALILECAGGTVVEWNSGKTFQTSDALGFERAPIVAALNRGETIDILKRFVLPYTEHL